jgi:hypothetical protein
MPPTPDTSADELRKNAATARRLADDFSPRDAEQLRRIADEWEARAAALEAAEKGGAHGDGEA